MEKNKIKNYDADEHLVHDGLGYSASSGEATGLMPTAPDSRAEEASLRELHGLQSVEFASEDCITDEISGDLPFQNRPDDAAFAHNYVDDEGLYPQFTTQSEELWRTGMWGHNPMMNRFSLYDTETAAVGHGRSQLTIGYPGHTALKERVSDAQHFANSTVYHKDSSRKMHAAKGIYLPYFSSM